jgi:hypothetical protein
MGNSSILSNTQYPSGFDFSKPISMQGVPKVNEAPGFSTDIAGQEDTDPYGLAGSLPGSFKGDLISEKEAQTPVDYRFSVSNAFAADANKSKNITVDAGGGRSYPPKASKQNTQDGKSGKWSQPVREMAVNVGLGIGNWMLDQVNKVRERKRMEQIDKIIQENRFAVAPTDRGMYMTNTAAPVPPTQQTPVQFTGYNPSAFAKYGKEKKNDYVYLTPQQIMDVISMGGEVEFLD